MSSLPVTTARERPENIAILLREPFRSLSEQLIEHLAAHGHGEVRFAHGNVFQYLDDAGTRVSVLAELECAVFDASKVSTSCTSGDGS